MTARARVPFSALLALMVVALPARADEGHRLPNVVWILSDDQGTLDLNCYGSRDLHTPNLDSLARSGVRFTQFYTACPVCSPARAALLTGRYPERAGVPRNVGIDDPVNAGLPPSETTAAEVLKRKGYRTGLVGKWHLGSGPGFDPQSQGFDTFFGHKQGCIDNYSHFFYWSGPPRHDLWRGTEEVHEDGVHFSGLCVREAERFIEANKERPFFLFLAFNTPHYPLQPPAAELERYRGLDEPRRTYAAAVTALDQSVGAVLAKLDSFGLRNDTIVIFLSDHGHSTEERCGFGGGNSGPYRGAKFSLFEGGIRVPCIASWPGHLPAGETRDQPAMSIDWLPTIAEICGGVGDLPAIDGKSLLPILKSRDAPPTHDVLRWQLEDQWAVREGSWKLVMNANDTKAGNKLTGEDAVFLVDLSVDPGERINFRTAYPDVVERLTKLHR